MKLRETRVQFHEDDRGQRALNVFPDISGQINVTYVNSTEHVVAWHRHKIQTDYWFCVKGSFKVGIAHEEEGNFKVSWHYISDKNIRSIEIPPGLYHGYKALESDSILLYYLTEKYDPDDEYKVLPGTFGESWETVSK